MKDETSSADLLFIFRSASFILVLDLFLRHRTKKAGGPKE